MFEIIKLYTDQHTFEQDCEFERDIQKERNDEYNRPSNEELGIEVDDDDSDPD